MTEENKGRYKINKVNLCKFICSSKKTFELDNEYYPERWCVIDTETNKAIDIKMELEYDFIPTFSGLHLASKAAELIRENKRAAIHDMYPFSYDEGILEKGNEIIEKLKMGYLFLDGNEVLNETAYFEALELEKSKDKKKHLKKIKRKRF